MVTPRAVSRLVRQLSSRSAAAARPSANCEADGVTDGDTTCNSLSAAVTKSRPVLVTRAPSRLRVAGAMPLNDAARRARPNAAKGVQIAQAVNDDRRSDLDRLANRARRRAPVVANANLRGLERAPTRLHR